jgi:hypothetical protein
LIARSGASTDLTSNSGRAEGTVFNAVPFFIQQKRKAMGSRMQIAILVTVEELNVTHLRA